MCINMCIDIRAWPATGRRRSQSVGCAAQVSLYGSRARRTQYRHRAGMRPGSRHLCMDMCMDVCMEVCMEVCMDMCMDVCMDVYLDVCMDLCMEICIGLP